LVESLLARKVTAGYGFTPDDDKGNEKVS